MFQAISKTQKILFVALALVVVYAVFDVLTKEDSGVPHEHANAQSNTVVRGPAVAVQSRKSFDYWKRDPFSANFEIPLHAVVDHLVSALRRPEQSVLQLTAISMNGASGFAVINDEVVGIGDLVNGFTVVDIQSNAVVLKNSEHSLTLTLPDESGDH